MDIEDEKIIKKNKLEEQKKRENTQIVSLENMNLSEIKIFKNQKISKKGEMFKDDLFKPMKKPYNIKDRNFMEILIHINKNKNGKLDKRFTYKRKMVVRDWLFYFYWCYKCKTSIYNFNSNPIRAEFSRFFNMYYKNELEKLNDLEEKKTNDEKNIKKE